VLLRTQPDERLVAMARDGDGRAFDELARRHRPALTAYAGSLSPSSRAEDVVQDSLLKAFLALRQGAQPELFRAWLFRIVRNSAIDEQRGVRPYEQLDENYDGVEQPPQALARKERLGALMLAIQDLPAAQRQAIVERELEGRGHEEIAQTMKVSPGSVRQLIYRARHTLREAAGAMLPAAVLRVATTPGAGEAVGGAGAAAAFKVGLAALVATGTIVAGTSIDHGGHPGTAEALQLSSPHGARSPVGSEHASAGHSGGSADRSDGRGSSGSDTEKKDSPGQGDSGEHGSPGPGGGGDGVGEHSGPGESGDGVSGGGGSGSNSGPGSHDSGGGSISGSGEGSGSGVSGGGSPNGEGSDDGQTVVETTTTGSSDGYH
jgi:RNA polymerase sigma factor (sigma-70 family)